MRKAWEKKNKETHTHTHTKNKGRHTVVCCVCISKSSDSARRSARCITLALSAVTRDIFSSYFFTILLFLWLVMERDDSSSQTNATNDLLPSVVAMSQQTRDGELLAREKISYPGVSSFHASILLTQSTFLSSRPITGTHTSSDITINCFS